MFKQLLFTLILSLLLLQGCSGKPAAGPETTPPATSANTQTPEVPAGTAGSETPAAAAGTSPSAQATQVPAESTPASEPAATREPDPAGTPLPSLETASPHKESETAAPSPSPSGTSDIPHGSPSSGNGTPSADPALQKIGAPTGLADDEQVEASDAADLDADGTLERVYLIRTAKGELRLEVHSVSDTANQPTIRTVLGESGKADLLKGPVVSALLLERFSDHPARDIAIGFGGLAYGDSQWAIYRHVVGEPLRLMRLEPFAVDTGLIALRDEDGDGRFERLQYPGHVVRVHRYEESLNGFAPVAVRSFSTETFDWTTPSGTAQGWLYLLYNRIEPDYSRLMNRPAPDMTVFSLSGYPDLFTPYPSWDGRFAGTAFSDFGVLSWQGLPSAETVLLSQTANEASARLAHVSEFDETRRASVRLSMTKRTDGTWSVTAMEQEVVATLCVASDDDNRMVIDCAPVHMTRQEASEGFLPLRAALEAASGIQIASLRQEGSLVLADLPEPMRFYLNQGSTGAAMRVNTLIRTLLSLPEAKQVRITIAGEADVEMDHYSFKGAWTLDGDRELKQLAAVGTAARPELPEEVAEQLFSALASENYEAFARCADPVRGTTLAIYGFVTEDAPVFDASRWLGVTRDERIHQFGFYDGSGFPIQTSTDEWLHLFFMPHRQREEWERTIEKGTIGTGLATPQEIWPEATHIIYRWAGSEQYDGMDWRSLTFVMTKQADGWVLTGLVSSQWTI